MCPGQSRPTKGTAKSSNSVLIIRNEKLNSIMIVTVIIAMN
jgi:hypothetical protein